MTDAEAILGAIGGGTTKPTRRPNRKKAKAEAKPPEGLLGFDEIKPKGRLESPERWSSVVFARYVADKYRDRYGEDMIKCGYQFRNVLFNRLRENIASAVRTECDNFVLKQYIDFYFERHLDEEVKRSNEFFLAKLDNTHPVLSFSKFFNKDKFVPRPTPKRVAVSEAKREGEEVAAPAARPSLKDVAAMAKISDEALVTTYGLVVAGAYKIFVQHISAMDGWSMIEMAAIRAVKKQKKLWINIKSATERHGPYPDDMLWMDLGYVSARIAEVAGAKLEPVKVSACEGRASEFFR